MGLIDASRRGPSYSPSLSSSSYLKAALHLENVLCHHSTLSQSKSASRINRAINEHSHYEPVIDPLKELFRIFTLCFSTTRKTCKVNILNYSTMLNQMFSLFT